MNIQEVPSVSKSYDLLDKMDLSEALKSGSHQGELDINVQDIIIVAIHQAKLVRLILNKGFGVQQRIIGRILDFDPQNSILHLYHDDEKQVYIIHLNEIDEFLV